MALIYYIKFLNTNVFCHYSELAIFHITFIDRLIIGNVRKNFIVKKKVYYTNLNISNVINMFLKTSYIVQSLNNYTATGTFKEELNYINMEDETY